MNKAVLYTIVIVITVAIIVALYFMLKTLGAVIYPTPSTIISPSSTPSSTPVSSSPQSSTPSSSPSPSIPYIVDYVFLGRIDSSVASSIANSLNQYLALNGYQNGILYYVIWVPSSGSCSHATIIYASQSAFNSLNSQVENIITQNDPFAALFGISIDYQSLGPCSTIAQIIPSTAFILAVNGMCT